MIAGACVATLIVAGNGYVVRTTSDELRGRVFTALESVQRLSLLLSMIVMAPIADLIGKYRLRLRGQPTTTTARPCTGPARASRCSSLALIVMGGRRLRVPALRWSPTVAAPLLPRG